MTLALTATVGLPGSGKSTWADQQVAEDQTGKLVVVNRDHLRAMLRKPYPTAEGLVSQVQRWAIKVALAGGYSVISDDTNLNPDHLAELQEIALSRGAVFEVNAQFLFVPLDEVLRRNACRPEALPEQAIRNLRDRWKHRWPQLTVATPERAW